MSLNINNEFYEYYIHQEKQDEPFILYEVFNDIKTDFDLCIDVESKIGDEKKYKNSLNKEYNLKIKNKKIIILKNIISTNINIFYNYLYNKLKKLKYYFTQLINTEPYIQKIINNCITHYEQVFQENINFIKENIDDVNKWLHNTLSILQDSSVKKFRKTLTDDEKKEHRKITYKKYYDSIVECSGKEKRILLTDDEKKEHRKINNAKYYKLKTQKYNLNPNNIIIS